MTIFTYAAIGFVGDRYAVSSGVLKAIDLDNAKDLARDAFRDKNGYSPDRIQTSEMRPETVRQIAIDAGVLSI